MPTVRETPPSLWSYPARLMRVVDGDTIVADIDLGFGVWQHERSIRLRGVWAPERTGKTREAGRLATEELRALLTGVTDIVVSSDRLDSFGRIVGMVWLADGLSVNKSLSHWTGEERR